MWIFNCIVVVILITMILSALRLKEENNSADKDCTIHFNCSWKYFNPYMRKLFSKIDTLFLLTEGNSGKISQESYNTMLDVYNKGNEIEQMIKEYWNNAKIEKDFSYYIDLHYASHLLGEAIKQEQQIIEKIYIECKQMQKQSEDKVIKLKYEFRQINGKKKRKVEQEIEKYCRFYKQILTLTGRIGMINIKYNQKVKQQHIQTGKRRDFIAENFGERGRQWKERMHNRTESGKEIYKMRGLLH